jgi:cold shock CspA family protein
LIRKGVISFFNESKGYGFIKDLKNQASVFVHINGLLEQVKENDKVTFEIEMTHKGASATKVQIDRGDKVPAAPVAVAEAKPEEPKTDEAV